MAEIVPQSGAHPSGMDLGPGRHLSALLPECHSSGGVHQRGVHGGCYRLENTHLDVRLVQRMVSAVHFVIFQHSDNPLHSARVKDAHQSEERRFLRRGVQLAAEKEA